MDVRAFLKKHTEKNQYWLMRYLLLRALGFVFFFAFLSLAVQVLPLLGENGLMPAEVFLERTRGNFASNSEAFLNYPTIFWFGINDTALTILAWLGVALSLVVLIGFANAPLLLLMWILYMSFVHIGQTFYGFGWETQLLETTLLAAFLAPLWDPRPFPKTRAPLPIIVLFKWLAFRIYIGAGFIKIRGDECWRNLTCLYYHYETQPIPNPISPFLHFMPQWLHKLGVVWNHFVELIVPVFIFGTRWIRTVAGIVLISFQFMLILSGNLSFLNWLTVIPAIACFDDKVLGYIMPKAMVTRAKNAEKKATISTLHTILAWCMVVLVIIHSVPVVNNLFFAERQHMNASFSKWHVANTYGAFGSIGKTRPELVVEGSIDGIEWKEYEFLGKPTGTHRPLSYIAPYQPRVDWQIWFAAMSTPERHPWLLHMVWKLLDNDELTLQLVAFNPFPNEPPKYIRIQYYEYQFAPLRSEAVWERETKGMWLNPVSKETKELEILLQAYGWS